MKTHPRQQPTLEDWIRLLRSTARRSGDVTRIQHPVGPEGFLRFMGMTPCKRRTRDGIDETLWLAVCADTVPEDAIESVIDPAGPLHRQADTVAIELWTERELGALHALWRLAVIGDHQAWRERAFEAARWHIKNTQPDNATNHPWAIPVMLDLWKNDPDSEVGVDARLYAETLLHNCQTQSAMPDPLSALILLDAANGLEMLLGSD